MSTLNKIFNLQKLRGINDSELARRIGLSRSTITDWKNGKTSSYNKHIKDIAEALNVTPEFLIDNNSDMLYGDVLDGTFKALSIELNIPYNILVKTFEENYIPDGCSNVLSKKSLKDFFCCHLHIASSTHNDVSLYTDAQMDLLEISNTLTDDEILDVINYINYIKSKRAS